MKHRKLLKIFLLIMFISCSKSKEDGIPETYQMEVLEYKTNIPLPSVKIDLYRCSNYDNIFGCLSKSLFATKITDNNGRYSFTLGELNKANEGIVLHKAKYWNAQGGQGKRYMSPEAWIDLHLIRQNNYPDTSLFRVCLESLLEKQRVNAIQMMEDFYFKEIYERSSSEQNGRHNL